MMKYGLLLTLAVTACAFAQNQASTMAYQTQNVGPGVRARAFVTTSHAPVPNEPYSATVAIETIQTLPDGNRIVQHLTGTIARDSQGRTRRDIPASASAAKAPHMVFIQDPVTQTAYALNLTDKTAQKVAFPSTAADAGGGSDPVNGGSGFVMQMGNVTSDGPEPRMGVSLRTGRRMNVNVSKENLGSKTLEGLLVNGTRTTWTIPAGQIGNARPITSVTETWTSPDLQTVIFSKRTDPLMGEEIYQLTNINRAEPGPALFTVPPDFKVVDGPRAMVIRRSRSQN